MSKRRLVGSVKFTQADWNAHLADDRRIRAGLEKRIALLEYEVAKLTT